MAHPVPALLNAGWIETTGGDFRFYNDGVSPSVARAMDAADRDRLAIIGALGLPAVPATEWDRRLYGLVGETTYELNRDSWVHRDIRAPKELRSRYLTEDVPFGLVPIASIGRELGIATPTIDLVIDLACLLLDEDLRAAGRTAASLGLAGRTAADDPVRRGWRDLTGREQPGARGSDTSACRGAQPGHRWRCRSPSSVASTERARRCPSGPG